MSRAGTSAPAEAARRRTPRPTRATRRGQGTATRARQLRPPLRAKLPEYRAERLPAAQRRLEQVAVPFDTLERLAHPEVPRPHLLAELLPAKRHRHRRARLGSDGVRGRDRLA